MNKAPLFLTIVLLTTGLCNFSSADAYRWTPSELNINKSKIDGQSVVLRGFLIHESENYTVWDSESASIRGDAAACISLLYPSSLKTDIKRSNRKFVTLAGLFTKNVTSGGGIFLGLCNYTGINVTQILDE